MNSPAKPSLFRSASLVAASHVGTILHTAVLSILLARFLGAKGKGEVALVMGLSTIVAQLACFGFDRAAPYYLAGKRILHARVVGAWWMTMVIGTVLGGLVVYPVIISFFGDVILKGIPTSLVWVGATYGLLYMFRLMVNSILAGYEAFPRQTLHNVTMFGAALIGGVISLVILRATPFGYISIQVLLGFVSLGFGFLLLKNVVSLKPTFAWRDWFQMVRYGSKAMLSQVFHLIDLRLDIFVLNYYLNPAAVGVYSVAGALAGLFWILSKSAGAVLFPRVSAMDPRGSSQLTALLCRNLLWLTLIAGGVAIIISKPVIAFVYGEEFAPASVALALLMPGVLAQVVGTICFADCLGRGHPGQVMVASVASAVTTIGLDLILIPKHGMAGAAIASSIAYLVAGIMGVYWVVRSSDSSVVDLLIPRRDDLRFYRMAARKIMSRFRRKGHNNA